MNDICVSLSKAIEPVRAETLVHVARIAARHHVPFVIVGAFARDVHFEHVWGIPTRRNTADLDLAVQVTDWPHYARLRAGLQRSRFFSPVGDRQERFIGHNGAILDVIPFGGVAGGGQVISWPPGNDRMSVVGVADVYDHAQTLEVTRGKRNARIHLASLPGLVLLKIVAIYDRKEARVKKDTDDIDFIIGKYLDAGNRSRLGSGPDSDLARNEKLDLYLASARLLGRDMARISSSPTRKHLLDILIREAVGSSSCPIAQQLRRRHRGKFARARQILSALLRGYQER